MSPAILGALLGVGVAGGIWLVVLAYRDRVSVADRVLPFVRSSTTHWDLAQSRGGGRWRAGALKRAFGLLESMWGSESTRTRLERAGLEPNLDAYRLQQLQWACLGLGVGVGVGLLRSADGHPVAVIPWVVMSLAAAMCGAALRDQALSRAARQRAQAIDAELPAVAELLAFTVSAGLAPASALNRVAHRLGGHLAAELRRATDEIAAGRSFSSALEAVADRTGTSGVQRFVDGIVVAMERGTPIAEVLRSQAMDARDAGHRTLMESAGRREIFALVPVVFLILPIVVVVAVFPGFSGLVVSTP